MFILRLSLLLFIAINLGAQQIPSVYSNISFNKEGLIYFTHNNKQYFGEVYAPYYTVESFTKNITGTKNGLSFAFTDTGFYGKMHFGLIHYNDSKHPYPVYYKNFIEIISGKVDIDIKNQLSNRYDMTNWEESGTGVLGYRIQDETGYMIYEGRLAFSGTGPFSVANFTTEGPFVDLISHNSATISFKTFHKIRAEVEVGDKVYKSTVKSNYHEIEISDLKPNTKYPYTLNIGGILQKYSFKTAPLPGSRTKFTFAYASDSRSGPGGGERTIHGTNFYIMRKIMALATQQKAAFMQFTGDLINGYLSDEQETNLQYANWKSAIAPWAHYMPVYEGMGNHEAVTISFPIPGVKKDVAIDKFPFETNSSEAIFNANFVNPKNGPKSEDGASYDPNQDKTDFPSYIENVYHYKYDNIAVICLNSDYLYAPMLDKVPRTSGNLHGYIMDIQLQWLEEVVKIYENDNSIDHIFVTQHTPAFPNGGHVEDDMWYYGNNQYRPWIAGKPLAKGIIERRDEYLDILFNKSKKVVAILTGDEHNYCRTKITPDMPRYPEKGYFAKRTELTRTIYQINNGAAGAPYYAQQQTPWTSYVEGFTTQNALVLFHIEGNRVELEVINPDTLENIDNLVLRE